MLKPPSEEEKWEEWEEREKEWVKEWVKESKTSETDHLDFLLSQPYYIEMLIRLSTNCFTAGFKKSHPKQ